MAELFYKRARRYALYKLSTTAPVNKTKPSFYDAGNGYLMCDKGTWDQYPVDFEYEWYYGGKLVSENTFYQLKSGQLISGVSLNVTASNDKGSTLVTVP